MIKKFLIYTFLFWIVLLNSHFAEAKTKHEILGLRVGMSKEEALNRLQEIGSKERDERKQQEIWNLTNDKHYSCESRVKTENKERCHQFAVAMNLQSFFRPDL